MTGKQLAQKATDIAKNYKTSYIWGGLGRPITEANLQKAVEQYSKNKTYAPKARKYVDQKGAFYFDCVGLIKCILWGWNGDASKSRGGAVYGSNGVPDISADTMITKCSGVSTNFDKVEIGEALWCSGHIGIYIGDGLAVECTPAWKNGVQITAVSNMGAKSGYNARKWTKHGKLPYVSYEPEKAAEKPKEPEKKPEPAPAKPAKPKIVPPKSFDTSARKGIRLDVTASYLNLRGAPNPDDNANIIQALPKGTKVYWYGYYTNEFYFVQLVDGTTGYVSKRYLKRL